MSCDTQTYSLTPDQFVKLKALIPPESISSVQPPAVPPGIVQPENGQVVYEGCTFTWAYSNTLNALSIACIDKPWYVSCGRVTSKLNELIATVKA